MEGQFTEIKKQLELLMASGIVKTLTPLLGQRQSSKINQLEGTTTDAISVSVTTPAVTSVTSPVTGKLVNNNYYVNICCNTYSHTF